MRIQTVRWQLWPDDPTRRVVMNETEDSSTAQHSSGWDSSVGSLSVSGH